MKNEPQQSRHKGMSRRKFLGGTALGLTLPWMESFPLWSEESGKRERSADSETPPTRFACIYFSNGVEPEHWWAQESSDGMRVGPGLGSLKDWVGDFSFVRGLFNRQAVLHPSPHLGRIPNMLSGAWVSNDQKVIRVGKTMDQVLAQSVGLECSIPSLVLGIEPTELRLEDGLSMLYGSCISWASDTKPALKEIYPARVFDAIVGRSGRDPSADGSVLDEILEDARWIRGRINSPDREKLDEFFESVREVESRIQNATSQQHREGWRPSLSEPDMERPDDRLPHDIPTHMQMMLDLIVLAFRMDKTRIATCMLNNDLSQMNFGFLKDVQGSLHLDLTHNGRDPTLEAMYLKTNQFHSQQLAYLIQKMKSIPEGEGSLLDHSMILFGSNLFDGDRHQADHMPLLLAGGSRKGLRPGRILDFLERPDSERRACNLYLSLMNRMGLSLTTFGDSEGPLRDI